MSSEWPSDTIQPLGIYIKQSWVEIGALFRLIDEFNVGTFIEVGMYRGGLAAYMLTKCMFVYDFQYRGIELDQDIIDEGIVKLVNRLHNAKIYIANCFSDALQQFLSKGIELSVKPVMVYCVGEDIPREFKDYIKILRPGDLIVAQDFPLKITLAHVKSFIDDGKLKRVVRPYLSASRMIVGELF